MALPGAKPAQRLAIVDLSLAVELDHFNAAGELHAAGAPATRRQLIERLRAGNDAAYGTGLIGRRQYLELDGTALAAEPRRRDDAGRVPAGAAQRPACCRAGVRRR